MSLSEILRRFQPAPPPGVDPIVPSARLLALRDRLGTVLGQSRLLQVLELEPPTVSPGQDHEALLLAARRLARGPIGSRIAARAGADEATLQELVQAHAVISQGEAAFARLALTARRGMALLLADLTERVDRIDEAIEAVLHTATPAERVQIEVHFQADEHLRRRGERAQQARRDRREARRALLLGCLSEERRRTQALWTLERLRALPLPPRKPPEGRP